MIRFLGFAWERTRAFLFGGLSAGARAIAFWGATTGASYGLGVQTLNGVLAAIVGAIALFSVVFVWNFWLAPYRVMQSDLVKQEGRLARVEGSQADVSDKVEASLNKLTTTIDQSIAENRDVWQDSRESIKQEVIEWAERRVEGLAIKLSGGNIETIENQVAELNRDVTQMRVFGKRGMLSNMQQDIGALKKDIEALKKSLDNDSKK
ncbi:MAG: hypothetical protein ABIP91_04725 [Sphingomicrobium sp.]